jgi:hypothetical protein
MTCTPIATWCQSEDDEAPRQATGGLLYTIAMASVQLGPNPESADGDVVRKALSVLAVPWRRAETVRRESRCHALTQFLPFRQSNSRRESAFFTTLLEGI